MKKITLLFLLTFTFVSILMADIVNQSDAAKVAKNHYFSYSTVTNMGSIAFDLAFTKTINGEPVYYIYNVGDNNGFVIVSAEDNVYPILGYSFEGSYTNQPGFVPENFNYWMDNCSDQIVFAREKSLKADEKIESTWNNLRSSYQIFENFYDVDPLLSTLWNQGTYYNQLCPTDPNGPGGHVWAGCVATAMGQVMKHHDHPDQGTGSHSYYAAGYGTQSANFGTTTYEWASMPNQVNSNNIPVATLLYHLGVSVEMQYSPNGSGAYSSDARDALVEYFGYSSNAQLLPKNSFPIETFEYKLQNELNLNRPVYYSGSGSGGGHAFVCDGYQGDDYFHFNWGWSGYGDGYFYLNNLNPGGSQFNQGQAAIFYAYPEGSSTLGSPVNFTAEIVDEDVHLAWDPPSGKDLLGYNIYRNNILVEYTSNTEYIDLGPEQGSYTYYACAVHDEGESFPSESISIFIGGGITTVFEDNFEAYSSGDQLACENSTDWTTWSNAPCGNEDAYITSDVTFTGSNAIIVEDVNDVVKLIENYTEGLYKISFQMYVPAGYLGYFNTLQLFAGTNSSWGMQVYFNNGQGAIDGGGESAATFSFSHNTWMYNEVIVDMNNDWAEYKLDGTSIHGWQWSIGAFGQNSLNQLGGVNLFAWDDDGNGTPKYYIDEFMIEEFGPPQLLPPFNFTLNVAFENIQLNWDSPAGKDLLGYNIYYAFNGGEYSLIANTDETSYVVESPGNGMHSFYLTAVYDEGESDPTNVQEVLLTVTEEFEDKYISVFPNPANQYVYIDADKPILSVRILNNAGQELMSKTISDKSVKLDISELKQGIYFLLIESGDKSFIRQLVKN